MAPAKARNIESRRAYSLSEATADGRDLRRANDAAKASVSYAAAATCHSLTFRLVHSLAGDKMTAATSDATFDRFDGDASGSLVAVMATATAVAAAGDLRLDMFD